MRRSAARLVLAGAVAVMPSAVPAPEFRISGPTRDFVAAQCRAAAAGVSAPGAARRQVGPEAGRMGQPILVSGVVDWYRGSGPGRYVAVLEATSAGAPVRIRASVVLRGGPCRLQTWSLI